MSDLDVFWSYSRADNDSERGRIVNLAKFLKDEYEFRTGETMQLFVDQDITWGSAWRATIDQELFRTTALIPILTPRFLKRQECRREVLEFSATAKSRGIGQLLLPILYAKPTVFDDDVGTDEVVELLRARQWEVWTELRLRDESSEPYRVGVTRLVDRLLGAVKDAERTVTGSGPFTIGSPAEVDGSPGSSSPPDESGDDAPGYVERMSEMNDAFQRLTPALLQLPIEITSLTDVMTRYGPRFRSAHEPRLMARVLDEFAKDLDAPIKSIDSLSETIADEVLRISPGVIGSLQWVRNFPSALTNEVRDSLYSLSTLDDASAAPFESIEGLAETVRQLAGASTALRPRFRKLEGALRRIVDIRLVFQDWKARISEFLDGFPPSPQAPTE